MTTGIRTAVLSLRRGLVFNRKISQRLWKGGEREQTGIGLHDHAASQDKATNSWTVRIERREEKAWLYFLKRKYNKRHSHTRLKTRSLQTLISFREQTLNPRLSWSFDWLFCAQCLRYLLLLLQRFFSSLSQQLLLQAKSASSTPFAGNYSARHHSIHKSWLHNDCNDVKPE